MRVDLDRTKLLAARVGAVRARPYLAAALHAMSIVPTAAVPTMAVDRRWRCYVSPEFVAATPMAELAWTWVHLVAHLLRDHAGRADRLPAALAADPSRANVAQDCEINDDDIDFRLPMPRGAVHPREFYLPSGQLFERYLDRMPVTRWASGEGRFVTVEGHCGSGATGRPAPWDLPAEAAPGVDPTEAPGLRQEAARAIRKARGSVPERWRRWARAVLEPTVDWRRVLAGHLRAAAAWSTGATDYTYQRPSRRSGALPGVVLPALRRPLPRVAIVVDTSGSMTDTDLAAALAEVSGVLRSVGVGADRTAVLSCDADVEAVRRVTRADQVVLAGGGGTDMRVGIDAALALPSRPHIVVVLTDGETPWPERQPHCRVVVGLVGSRRATVPAWAQTVRIDVDAG